MKTKIKNLTLEQRQNICKSISFDCCCESTCPLCDTDGKCSVSDVLPASPEFEEKEIEVQL